MLFALFLNNRVLSEANRMDNRNVIGMPIQLPWRHTWRGNDNDLNRWNGVIPIAIVFPTQLIVHGSIHDAKGSDSHASLESVCPIISVQYKQD